MAKKRLHEVKKFKILEATVEAEHLTREIISAGVIPVKAVGDAAHIAVATVNEMDYLLTWNCRHLANAQLIRRVSVICNMKGFNMPVTCNMYTGRINGGINKMYDDPIVNEVREIRERLSKKHNFEVEAIFDDIRKRQALVDSRLVRHRKRMSAERSASPDRGSAALHPGR